MKYEVTVKLIVEGKSAEEIMDEVETELSFPEEFWDKIKDTDYSVSDALVEKGEDKCYCSDFNPKCDWCKKND